MQFSLKTLPNNLVELTVEVDYETALKLLQTAKNVSDSDPKPNFQINYDATLRNFRGRDVEFDKIGCIKVFREITGYGLKDSKEFTEGRHLELSHMQLILLEKKGIFVKSLY